jgi:photosystem II stability/assembly factor-like uncharacterized protein
MKKLFFLSFLWAIISTVTQSQTPGIWTFKGSGIKDSRSAFQSIAAVDANIVWGITYDAVDFGPSQTFSRTANGGKTWRTGIIDPSQVQNFSNISIVALDSMIAWVLMTNAGSQNVGRIYKTIDGGQNWKQQIGSFNDLGNAITGIHFFDKNNGVTFGSPGTGNPAVDSLRIWTTIDGGNNWTRIAKSQLPPVLAGEGIWVIFGNGTHEARGDTLSFVTRRARVWKTTDRGKTWTATSTGANEIAYTIAYSNSKNGLILTQRSAYITKDGGMSWGAIVLPPSRRDGYYQVEAIPGQDKGFLISYEGSSTLYTLFRHAYTLDHGVTWIPIENPGNVQCFDFLSPTLIWGGGSNKNPEIDGMFLWTGKFGTTTSVNKLNEITNQFKLSPNPFTDQTMLEFELKDPALPVDISVMDAWGRILKTFHVKQPGIGLTQIPLEIDAPAGLLLLNLRQGDQVQGIKLLKQ